MARDDNTDLQDEEFERDLGGDNNMSEEESLSDETY
jgi:hypothetical protein